MTLDSDNTAPRRSAIMTTRIIWAALLMGQVVFLAVVLTLRQNAEESDAAKTSPISHMLFYTGVFMLIVAVPAAYFLRSTIYRRGGSDRNVTPQAYITGNILFLAICEGVSFVGLIGILLSGTMWPHLAISMVAIAVQSLNFPTGNVMCA